MDFVHDESSQSNTKRVKSEVWQHFTRIKDSDRAKCNYCSQSYAAHSTKNGTSNLLKHLRSCRKYDKNVDIKQRTLIFQRSKSDMNIDMSFTTMSSRDFLAKMIILDELPIKVVEGIGFRTFCRHLNCDFTMPSRKTISSHIKKIFEHEKSNLQEYFISTSQMVSLTTDTWTSIQNLNYMVLTAHFIDEDWVIQKKILNFCLIPNHQGESIGKEIEQCLLNWKINNVTTITVDNASSNDVVISYLKKIVKAWRGLILDGAFMHVRCFAHVLNLVVSDGLKEHDQSITKVRKAVKYVWSSPAHLQPFRICVQSVKIIDTSNLCLDVTTRWNSTYLMLASAVKYEAAFEKLSEDSSFLSEMGSEGPHIAEDWICIREHMKFLEAFHTMTVKVSASLQITSNIYVGEVCNLKIDIQKYSVSNNMTLQTMTKLMESKFDKYWGSFEKINMLLYVAIVPDPSCKTQFLKNCLSILFGIDNVADYSKQVEDCVMKLYSDYKNVATKKDQTPSSSQIAQMPPRPHSTLGQVRSTAVYSMFYGSENMNEINDGHNMSEIDQYLIEKLEVFSDNADMLFWWKRNSDRYPVLSKMARDILIIPISTVASESAFSCGGRVLDAFRSSLSPKTVEALICTQSWLKSFNPFKFTTSTKLAEDSTIDVTVEDIEAIM